MDFPSPETLQLAGLAVVSVSLVGLIYKLVLMFTASLDKLDNTLFNHFSELRALLAELKDQIVEHRRVEGK